MLVTIQRSDLKAFNDVYFVQIKLNTFFLEKKDFFTVL